MTGKNRRLACSVDAQFIHALLLYGRLVRVGGGVMGELCAPVRRGPNVPTPE